MIILLSLQAATVAPRAGAWIETLKEKDITEIFRSPPVRGRGLKLAKKDEVCYDCRSPPVRGRGLKLYCGP